MSKAEIRSYEQMVISMFYVSSDIFGLSLQGEWEAKQTAKFLEFQKKQKTQRDEEELMLRNHHESQMERNLLTLGLFCLRVRALKSYLPS